MFVVLSDCDTVPKKFEDLASVFGKDYQILNFLKIKNQISIQFEEIQHQHSISLIIILFSYKPRGEYENYISNYLEHTQKTMAWCKQQSIPLFIERVPIFSDLTKYKPEPMPYYRWVIENIEFPLYSLNPKDLKRNSEPLLILESHIPEIQKFEQTEFRFLDIQEAISLAIIDRVTGVYRADLGISPNALPGLLFWEKHRVMYCTDTLFLWDQKEFAPKSYWFSFLIAILSKLMNEKPNTDQILQKLPSILTGPNQFFNLSQKRKLEIRKHIKQGLTWFQKSGVLNGQYAEAGVFEGFSSEYDRHGKKTLKYSDYAKAFAQRGDCTMDTLMAFILPFKFQFYDHLNSDYEKISSNLLVHLLQDWQYWDESICRGLFGWYNDPYDKFVFYSDDNGRIIFQLLILAQTLKDEKLMERALGGAIALFQTHGINGHRPTRIDLKDIYKHKGRKWYRKHHFLRGEYKSPHYEAWTYAAILYGAWILGGAPPAKQMINLVEKGIRKYMKRFPNLHLEHSINDDFSKLLVALIILNRCQPTEEHHKWVYQVADFLLQFQAECGGIPERDPLGKHARVEKKNEKYGTGEAALYNSQRDTITDQLYSTPFLLWAFFFMTQEEKKQNYIEKSSYQEKYEKLRNFVMQSQLKSSNPQLDGAWLRAFDYHLGEPFGANGDVGWGAYSIETGWMVAPMITGLIWDTLDFDIFLPLEDKWQKTIQELFSKEFNHQQEIEKDWKNNTPPAPHR